MRIITDHKVNGLNEAITVTAGEEIVAGGPCYMYRYGFGTPEGATLPFRYTSKEIIFHRCDNTNDGLNGVTDEALLAILIDRLRSALQRSTNPNEIQANEVRMVVRVQDELAHTIKQLEGALAFFKSDTHKL